MACQNVDWLSWRIFFERRCERPLPMLDVAADYAELPRSVARSLAIFQLGESGGGTVVEQAEGSNLPGVDADYAAAVKMFVEEEHRHANILAMCVRMLGGELVQDNWTARLFVFGRRLIGLRLKVLVLLAAEVVGICYYYALASRLDDGPMKRWLLELVDDERSHLLFHCDFLRRQTQQPWQRRLFVLTWRTLMCTAAAVVMIDHRHVIRDMRLGFQTIWQRWMAYSRMAEQLVTGTTTGALQLSGSRSMTR